jgi:hypothetical protein
MEGKIDAQWELPSNSGRTTIFGRLKAVLDTESGTGLLFEISCRGMAFQTYDPGKLVEDFDFRFHEIFISQRLLKANVDVLRRWLATPFRLELNFTENHGSQFYLRLDKEDHIISTLEKPACTLLFRSGYARNEVAFVVDQSCVRIFCESISAFV